MSLEQRLEKLEDKMSITNAIPPLIRIDAMNCEKGSTDPGVALIGIVPGKIGGLSGFTLFRAEDETGADFLERCEARHTEVYS